MTTLKLFTVLIGLIGIGVNVQAFVTYLAGVSKINHHDLNPRC